MSYPKKNFRSLDLRSQISKRIMWIISKSHREKFFFLIFLQSIHRRHEKRCQLSLRLFSLFRGSIYQQWKHKCKYPMQPINGVTLGPAHLQHRPMDPSGQPITSNQHQWLAMASTGNKFRMRPGVGYNCKPTTSTTTQPIPSPNWKQSANNPYSLKHSAVRISSMQWVCSSFRHARTIRWSLHCKPLKIGRQAKRSQLAWSDTHSRRVVWTPGTPPQNVIANGAQNM